MVTRRWVLRAAAAAAADLRMNFDARAEETHANKTVFMTSDDGPNAATSIIVDIAERLQVPFTLFMIGTNVRQRRTTPAAKRKNWRRGC
jgi:peptidoglycan/xylan/chitin deacetylase (PgdA/CDA1 family)